LINWTNNTFFIETVPIVCIACKASVVVGLIRFTERTHTSFESRVVFEIERTSNTLFGFTIPKLRSWACHALSLSSQIRS